MLLLNKNENVECADCGKEYKLADTARHEKICAKGVIFVSIVIISITISKKRIITCSKSMLQPFPSN